MPDVRMKNLLVATKRECVAALVASGVDEDAAERAWHPNAATALEVSEEIFRRHMVTDKNLLHDEKRALIFDTWRDELRDWAVENLTP